MFICCQNLWKKCSYRHATYRYKEEHRSCIVLLMKKKIVCCCMVENDPGRLWQSSDGYLKMIMVISGSKYSPFIRQRSLEL